MKNKIGNRQYFNKYEEFFRRNSGKRKKISANRTEMVCIISIVHILLNIKNWSEELQKNMKNKIQQI